MLLNELQIDDWKSERLPEGNREPLFGRRELAEHLQELRCEFAGLPRLCYETAALMVYIRREIELEKNVAAFIRVLETELDFLCEILDSRWLVAIADTLADHGPPQEQVGAMIPVVLLNMTKLAETERGFLNDTRVNAEAFEAHRDYPPHPLWDGVSSFLLDRGDMPRNMFNRIRRVLEYAPLSKKIFETLLMRLQEHPNMLSRISQYNQHFWE